MTSPSSGTGTTRPRAAGGHRRGDGIALLVIAALTYLPLLVARRGRLDADTKQYLYLDPAGLLGGAPHLWNRRVSGGTVTHQNIGYLWPMGPYYWLTDALGIPDWIAQRLWMGSIMFAAAAGAYWLFRSLWSDRAAAVVAGLAYGLSPFVLGHITGQSALLLPFAALPWLVVAVRNALRADAWRWAAVFALITATAGSLNGSSIFFVLFGACLWIPYAIWWERTTRLRTGIMVLLRLGFLTLLTQLWWLVAYSVGGKYGLPILQVTETVRETSATTTATEVLRGLGYWFFYGGDNQGPWLDGVAPPFTQSLPLLVVSFVVPCAALLLGWWSRFRERVYFAGLVVGGLLISTIAYGTTDRSVVGTAFESASRSSGLVLSLRNTQRAAALVVLGLAGLAAAGITALRARDIRWGRIAMAVVVLGTVLTFVAPWSSALIADRYDRKEEVPRAWVQTGEYLDRVGGRAMVVPGIDFASYRWGHTLDPVLAGLTRTELVWRELLPMGGTAGADLVEAFDRGLQEGWFDPRTVVPVARALGVSHIVVANDLELERYRIVRPEVVMESFLDPDSGLTLERAFGPGYENRNPGRQIVDARTQQVKTDGTDRTLPQVAVFSVPGVDDAPVDATVKGAETVVHGDGAGVLAAAAEGLLDADHLPLLYGTELATWPAAKAAARGDGARHVVTDTARKEDRRYAALRENSGATKAADGSPRSGRNSDIAASEYTGGTDATQSITVLRGAESIDASGYGNVISLLAEDRPANAFDGDPRTSWRYDFTQFRDITADELASLRIDLGREVAADHVDVVQRLDRPLTQPFSRFEVVLDGTRRFPVDVDPATVLDPAGVRVALDGTPFSTLEVRIPDADFAGPVGVSEVVIPGVEVEELVRLPRSLTARGSADTPFPLAYVLTRLRLDPSDEFRMDPEVAMRRLFTVPTAMTFTLSGTARLNGRAADPALDALTVATPPGVTYDSSARLQGSITNRASAAVDGDPATAWSTPLGNPVGARWQARVDDGFGLPTLALDVVTDARHSIPTKVRVTVDGVAEDLALPTLAPGPAGTTTRVELTPTRPLTGRELTIEVLEVDPASGSDLKGKAVTLPAAIAEVDGLPRASTATTVDTGCRDDLLTVDGVAVPVRVAGDTGRTGNGRLTVAACDGAPIALSAGAHVLRTTPGLTTGLDLDRLALVSPQYAAAPGTASIPGGPEVVTADRGSAVIRGGGAPYWVRLDQSTNRGWVASAEWPGGSADLGEAHTVDAFASGWSMTRGTDARATFAFTWEPQGTVDLALAVSGLAALACLVLIVVRRRRPATDRVPAPVLAADPLGPARIPLVAAGLVVVVGAGFASLPVGVALAGFAVAAALTRRRRVGAALVRVAPFAALGAGLAYLWLKQIRNDYHHWWLWASYFDLAHYLVFFAVLAFALLVIADHTTDVAPAGAADPDPDPDPRRRRRHRARRRPGARLIGSSACSGRRPRRDRVPVPAPFGSDDPVGRRPPMAS